MSNPRAGCAPGSHATLGDCEGANSGSLGSESARTKSGKHGQSTLEAGRPPRLLPPPVLNYQTDFSPFRVRLVAGPRPPEPPSPRTARRHRQHERFASAVNHGLRPVQQREAPVAIANTNAPPAPRANGPYPFNTGSRSPPPPTRTLRQDHESRLRPVHHREPPFAIATFNTARRSSPSPTTTASPAQ